MITPHSFRLCEQPVPAGSQFITSVNSSHELPQLTAEADPQNRDPRENASPPADAWRKVVQHQVLLRPRRIMNVRGKPGSRQPTNGFA
ncbi:MAG: hypothetical protein ONB48_16340 [candidate division KSB1 bacterium]|nr:hypothetical protein [candidate division KSB1 bacterium]MDZ7274259.1 hypothetical protein [candidate division KSB1 bacterium]MDZ7287219.1 hypothetical protein [candidate division KSB1 bacterium]MDZ7306039.1 hypothetical protein [candidate division KSB1 bacterium]MDZ7347723.1 hypothetical protein [candidate division KSB1 bacterium]